MVLEKEITIDDMQDIHRRALIVFEFLSNISGNASRMSAVHCYLTGHVVNFLRLQCVEGVISYEESLEDFCNTMKESGKFFETNPGTSAGVS